ncbi:MAG: 2-oxoacid:acceptor oxidoreductase family protein [Nitrososphaerales archaeon]|nr:2-oxoacid:acceptor oxidoreductase family protein [Nitrososphaerales archaeon]
MKRFEVRFGGLGGQGTVLAGTILGHAAILSGLYATRTSSYGAEGRGTYAYGHVVISNEPVKYPFAIALDALVALHSKALDMELKLLKNDGLLMIDDEFIDREIGGSYKIVKIPAAKLAVERFGRRVFANMIMLGSLLRFIKFIPIESAELAIRDNIKVETDKNIEALKLGFGLQVD